MSLLTRRPAPPPHKHLKPPQPITQEHALEIIQSYLSDSREKPYLHPDCQFTETGPTFSNTAEGGVVLHQLRRVEQGLRGVVLGKEIGTEEFLAGTVDLKELQNRTGGLLSQIEAVEGVESQVQFTQAEDLESRRVEQQPSPEEEIADIDLANEHDQPLRNYQEQLRELGAGDVEGEIGERSNAVRDGVTIPIQTKISNPEKTTERQLEKKMDKKEKKKDKKRKRDEDDEDSSDDEKARKRARKEEKKTKKEEKRSEREKRQKDVKSRNEDKRLEEDKNEQDSRPEEGPRSSKGARKAQKSGDTVSLDVEKDTPAGAEEMTGIEWAHQHGEQSSRRSKERSPSHESTSGHDSPSSSDTPPPKQRKQKSKDDKKSKKDKAKSKESKEQNLPEKAYTTPTKHGSAPFATPQKSLGEKIGAKSHKKKKHIDADTSADRSDAAKETINPLRQEPQNSTTATPVMNGTALNGENDELRPQKENADRESDDPNSVVNEAPKTPNRNFSEGGSGHKSSKKSKHHDKTDKKKEKEEPSEMSKDAQVNGTTSATPNQNTATTPAPKKKQSKHEKEKQTPHKVTPLNSQNSTHKHETPKAEKGKPTKPTETPKTSKVNGTSAKPSEDNPPPTHPSTTTSTSNPKTQQSSRIETTHKQNKKEKNQTSTPTSKQKETSEDKETKSDRKKRKEEKRRRKEDRKGEK